MISSNSDKSPTKHFLFPVLKRNQIRPKIPKKIGEIFLISKEEFSESLIKNSILQRGCVRSRNGVGLNVHVGVPIGL